MAAAEPADVTRSDLPPSAILSETLAPFEQTRADMSNWSDTELAAFDSTVKQAKAECGRLEQTAHEAEEALALARLCSVGMDWDGTYSAARWYTRSTAPAGEAARLPLGFGLLLQADLNLQAIQRAINDLKEMQQRLPLSADTDSVFTYVVNGTQVMRPEYGLQAALMRQGALLKAIAGTSSSASPVPPGQALAEAWHALMLLHYAGNTDDEAKEKSKLLQAEAARSAQMSPLDRYVAMQGRTQYEWLGREAPTPPTRHALASGSKIDPPPAVELLAIQRSTASDVPTLSRAIEDLRKRLPKGSAATLVLVSAAQPAVKKVAAKQASSPAPSHVVTTEKDLFTTLGFANGPLFLLKDRQGSISYLDAGTAAWLNPQMQAEVLIGRALADDTSRKQE